MEIIYTYKRQTTNAKKMNVKAKDFNLDNVTTEDEVETNNLIAFALFSEILTILTAVLNGTHNTEKVLEGLIDGMDEEESEELFMLFEKVMTYLKVPKSAYDSLFDEDDDISKEELKNLKDIISEAVGENDLYAFVYSALYNPNLPTEVEGDDVGADDDADDDADDGVQTDSVQMDWSFFNKKGECFTHKTTNKKDTKKLSCMYGASDGKVGYWLYSKDFESKKTGGVSGSNHKSKTKNGFSKRNWSASSTKMYNRSMTKRAGKDKKSKSAGV